MTLYNNARHLPEALDSILAQTYRDFTLVMLDDGSNDDTERIAREYAARDSRIRFFRHPSRQGMVATWREAAEIAARECPSAECFAWVSDHDRWHPEWLDTLTRELDVHPRAVLAYPITRRITQEGADTDKGPRLFDTAGIGDLQARWHRYCHEGVGAGDMVYGLIRMPALQNAGIFRPVLRPDRLLISELVFQGEIRQVHDVLWFRRQSLSSSIARQRNSLLLPGDEPRWFSLPPWLQHTIVLNREYGPSAPRPLPVVASEWRRMLLRYQLTYGWRHLRKTETSHAIGRGIDNVIATKKLTKHYFHHAVYHTLVGGRAAWGRSRRAIRRGVYHALVLTHRLGLRGSGGTRAQ
jgi:glycosyltransferase involved in cell wall biosynthesis